MTAIIITCNIIPFEDFTKLQMDQFMARVKIIPLSKVYSTKDNFPMNKYCISKMFYKWEMKRLLKEEEKEKLGLEMELVTEEFNDLLTIGPFTDDL